LPQFELLVPLAKHGEFNPSAETKDDKSYATKTVNPSGSEWVTIDFERNVEDLIVRPIRG